MRILQVKQYNAEKMRLREYEMVMTLGNGSMADEPRCNGWVLQYENAARWFKNKKEAIAYSELLNFTRENIPQ